MYFKKQRDTETESEMSCICWFTPQMPFTASTGPGQAKARRSEPDLGLPLGPQPAAACQGVC